MAVVPDCSRNPQKDPSNKVPYRASEPSPSTVGAPSASPECNAFKPANNNSRSDKSAERRDLDQPRRTDSDHTRPETHQNLIHSNKEQRHPTGQHPRVKPKGMRHDHTTQDALPRHMIKPNSNIRDTDQSQPACPSRPTQKSWPAALIVCKSKRLPPCEDRGAHAVCSANGGGGDDRDRTDDPLLAKQVLSQLSYAPNPGTPDIQQTGSSDPPSPGLKHQRPTILDEDS
jgi:hypothetical protein